jgi:hypothetical protein
VNKHGYQSVLEILGDDEEDTALLREMAKSARDYISSFAWCPPISDMYLAYGVGKVIAIFLFEFSEKIRGTDDELWVVVGDLPNAYLVVEPDDKPAQALSRYCELMEDWISAVKKSGDLGNVFPVAAAATRENADLLRRRVKFLRKEIISKISEPDSGRSSKGLFH